MKSSFYLCKLREAINLLPISCTFISMLEGSVRSNESQQDHGNMYGSGWQSNQYDLLVVSTFQCTFLLETIKLLSPRSLEAMSMAVRGWWGIFAPLDVTPAFTVPFSRINTWWPAYIPFFFTNKEENTKVMYTFLKERKKRD